MRKAVCLISLIILIAISLANAENQVIFKADYESLENSQVVYSNNVATALTFQMGGIEVKDADLSQSGYSKLDVLAARPEKFGRMNEDGMPDLPLYSEGIIIPDQSGVRVNIISAEFETIEDVDIAPTQPSQIEGSDELIPFTKNEDFYSSNEFYPSELISVTEPAIFKDFRCVTVIVHPVQYNPVTRELRVYTDIDYEIVYEGIDSRNMKVRTDNYISEAFLLLYKEFFANAEEILTDYTPQRGGYLIVSAYSCTTRAKELAEWKHRKGYNVQIISTSDYGGNPTYGTIKNAIQSIYNNSDPALEYVAIIGDMNGSYGYKVATGNHSSGITDHPYSLLEGSDYEPDVVVSRMSVRDINDLNTVMAKTLTYEKDPYMSDPLYYKRGLAVGGDYGSTSPRFMATWVRLTMLDHGYYQADTVISNTSNSYYTNRITSIISNGVSLVTYRGWGGSSGWSYPYWNTGHIGQLTNGWKIGIMFTIVCGTGNFGVTECFAEAWLRAGSPTTPKGGVGAFGPVHGWTHTLWNNSMVMGITSALLEKDIYHLGAILIAGKRHQYNSFPHISGSRGWDWYYHTYNSLGDPELSVRTDTPKAMTATYNSTIPVGTNYLDVHIDAAGGGVLAGAYVCLVKGEGANEEVFTGGWTDENGNITLEFNTTTADSMHVTISYRDYIPHQGVCLVETQETMVAFNDMVIDDDNNGNSNGNSDGNINPTETVELEVELKNFGASITATNVVANLSSNNPSVQIINGSVNYPDIPPGQIANSGDKFVVHLDGDIPHDEALMLPLTAATDQGTYESSVFIHVKSTKFSHSSHSFPGGGVNLDPGETVNMVVNIRNIGELNGENLTGVLICGDSDISISDNTADFGTIHLGGSGSNR